MISWICLRCFLSEAIFPFTTHDAADINLLLLTGLLSQLQEVMTTQTFRLESKLKRLL